MLIQTKMEMGGVFDTANGRETPNDKKEDNKRIISMVAAAGDSDHGPEPDQYFGQYRRYGDVGICRTVCHGGFIPGEPVHLCAVLYLIWNCDSYFCDVRPVLGQRRQKDHRTCHRSFCPGSNSCIGTVHYDFFLFPGKDHANLHGQSGNDSARLYIFEGSVCFFCF